MNQRIFVYSLLSLLFVCQTNFLKAQSILSSGDIYKISVTQTGVHKISADFLQSTLGIDLSQTDPRNISIYGFGGGNMPELLNEDYPEYLVENPIYIKGEDDGRFDQGDYILFYAESPDKWLYDYNRAEHYYDKNIYDLENFYFIKINEFSGKRIEKIFQPTTVEETFNSYENRLHHEVDEINLLGDFGSTEGTGQVWYGEVFGIENTKNFSNSFQIKNPVIGSDALVKMEMVARGSGQSSFNLAIGSNSFSKNFGTVTISSPLATYASSVKLREQFTLNEASPNVSLSYNPTNGSSAWLNYIELIVMQEAIYQNQALTLVNQNTKEFREVAFEIENANDGLFVWDITETRNVKSLDLESSGNKHLLKYEPHDLVRAFVVFDENGSYPSTQFVEKVENKDLLNLPGIEFAIVYHDNFIEAAQKLADHRENKDGLKTYLVNIHDIYNEFGAGKNDPSAPRNFAKYTLDNNAGFGYMLLLGDGSYDYRGIVPGLEYQNFVPTYETKQSLNPISGFPSDDFFALLNGNEGDEDLSGDLDIAIGRLPARTAENAMAMVDKIVHYDNSNALLGDWKLNVGFAADDEDTNRHLKDSDKLAVQVDTSNTIFNQQKVYFDAFQQESTPGGERYPTANEVLIQNLERGQLLLNYLGHGGPKGWAQERVLQIGDINGLENMDRLPVVITATCSFTGYDDPGLVSAGELLISNPKGGAVALFTTVRAVFADRNYNLAKSVYDNIFIQENGQNMRLGDVMKIAKNNLVNDEDNKRKFTFIGDPTMQLSIPPNTVVLEQINEIDADQFKDTITALEEVTLSGSIKNYNQEIITDFNGIINLTVFDKKKEVETLSNDPESPVTSFEVRTNKLFKGSASVENGKFTIKFILPKDINFNNGYGKFSFYAHDFESSDAAGYFDKIIIGGSSNGFADDNPPLIDLFMNDESFAYGGITDNSPTLLVKLKDDFGINVSGTSIGHDLTFVIDDQNDQRVVLNDFYESTTDDFKSGIARYKLSDLSPGKHTIRVKAWDISNNSSESEIEFNVVDESNEKIFHVFNYPNPFTTSTNFTFESDLSDSDVNISIQIYTISGKLVKVIESSRYTTGYRISDISWDGKDDLGGKLAKGIYLYKIKMESESTGLKRESDFQRIVLL